MRRNRVPYPEVAAGGFTRVDGTVQFYVRVRALLSTLTSGSTVLDFGAGRGAVKDSPIPLHRDLCDLRRGPGRVIGVDIDPAVADNGLVDESHVIEPGGPIPLDDASVDIIVSDHTFEHITDPGFVATELTRVLKPGGWICARTPNRWGYIGVAARAIPNSLHKRVLSWAQPTREAKDIFPTAYALNTPRDLELHFPTDQYMHIVYSWDPEGAYVGRSARALRLVAVINRLTPERFRAVLMVFLHRYPPNLSGPSETAKPTG